MSLIHKAKNNNFNASLVQLGKLQEKTANTIPNHLSFALASNKLIDVQKDHKKFDPKLQLSAFPSKQSLLKMSRQDDRSSKQNGMKEITHLNNYFPRPPLIRQNNNATFGLENLYLPFSLPKNMLTNQQKARMICELNLKIELLQSKSKQPGLGLEDLVPLREEIYNKFDQYYITNRQVRSRFIENEQPDSQIQKVTARCSRSRKPSKELSAAHLKVDSKTSSPRSSLSHQSSCRQNAKPYSSKVFPSYDNEQTVNRKTYKTMGNFSVVSLTNRSNNQQEQERPIFETQLSEKEMIDLDREPERKMSEYEEEHHESYIQLKENVRIMEERIGFLIHRLEENKKQIALLRDSKDRIEKNCVEKDRQKYNLSQQKEQIAKNYSHLQVEFKKLKQKYEEKQKQSIILQKQSLQFQKTISQLTNEIEYLTQRQKIKENEFNAVEQLLIQKKAESEEIGHNLRSLEREFAKKRKELINQIQQKQHETEQLKSQLKEQKARMEVQGINFKFEEAAKLKKYIEENELLHQREIQKLDGSYSTVINNYQVQNRRIKNEKIQLENALVEWLGNYHKMESKQDHIEGTQFTSNLIKLEAVELNMGHLSGNQISNQFMKLLQNYSHLQKENNEQLIINEKLEERINILKEQYASIFEKKCEQTDNLSKKIDDLENINKILHGEKEEIHQELKQLKQMRKQAKPQISKFQNIKCHLQIMQYRYPQPQLALIDNGTSFLKTMNKMMKVPLKRKLQIILKLIDLALSFANKKKLPTLNPACLIVEFAPSNNDFSIEVNKNSKEDQDQNLHYCSPEVLLGFNETHQSHCWTIGIILDRLIHGKEYFSQYSQIISRKENYMIRDEKYKSLDFLSDMLRKNQRQRISLQEVRCKITSFLSISHLQ